VPIALMSVGGAGFLGGLALTIFGLQQDAGAVASADAATAGGVALMALGVAGISSGLTWIVLAPDAGDVAISPTIGAGTVGVTLRF
jgi:hypothetical protein